MNDIYHIRFRYNKIQFKSIIERLLAIGFVYSRKRITTFQEVESYGKVWLQRDCVIIGECRETDFGCKAVLHIGYEDDLYPDKDGKLTRRSIGISANTFIKKIFPVWINQ